jgi:hypothetical protein
LRGCCGKGRENATVSPLKPSEYHSVTPFTMNLHLLLTQTAWDDGGEGQRASLASRLRGLLSLEHGDTLPTVLSFRALAKLQRHPVPSDCGTDTWS